MASQNCLRLIKFGKTLDLISQISKKNCYVGLNNFR